MLNLPNRYPLALAGAFFPAFALSGLGLEAFWAHLATGALGLLAGILLFAFQNVGPAVGKLLAACLLWLGPSAAVEGLFWTALAGGVLSVLVLQLRRSLRSRPERAGDSAYLLDLAYGETVAVPYWIAAGAGALIAFPGSDLHAALAARLF